MSSLGPDRAKNINRIVNSIVQKNLTPQQRAFLALKQAIRHIDVRGLAKSAGDLLMIKTLLSKVVF